jgi:hypothetical protein
MAANREAARTVAALAGRRVDAAGSDEPRFPLDRVPAVEQELERVFRRENVEALVCSAACGADLVALDAARRIGIRWRIVLPFGRERFRRTSVVDRPGEWGALYDEVVAQAQARGDLVELEEGGGTDDDAYMRATGIIVSEALAMAGKGHAIAIAVWEGKARAGGDATAALFEHPRAAMMKKLEVRTL